MQPDLDRTSHGKLLNGVRGQPTLMPPLFTSRLSRTILANGLEYAPVRNRVLACLIASPVIIPQMTHGVARGPRKFLSARMPARAWISRNDGA
jgi:hypothetical protein